MLPVESTSGKGVTVVVVQYVGAYTYTCVLLMA